MLLVCTTKSVLCFATPMTHNKLNNYTPVMLIYNLSIVVMLIICKFINLSDMEDNC